MPKRLTKEQVREIRDVALACQQWAREKQGAARYGDAEVAFYKAREDMAARVLEALPARPAAVEAEEEADEDEDMDAGEEEDSDAE